MVVLDECNNKSSIYKKTNIIQKWRQSAKTPHIRNIVQSKRKGLTKNLIGNAIKNVKKAAAPLKG